MTVTVRQIGADDARVIADLNQFDQEPHVDAMPHYFLRTDHAAVAEWFASMLSREEVGAWIADVGGCPAGYALSIVRERPQSVFCQCRRFCELDQIAVSSAFRRKGVASALVRCVLDDASARGLVDVELSSWAFNTEAHDAFRALGFRPKVVRFGRDAGDAG